jgi:dTDP-4-dehydrorhamnose reductase
MIGICGASGYIGGALYKYLRKKKLSVMGTYFNRPAGDLKKFDLREDSFEIFDECDFVVILSAYVKIRWCEANQIEAYWLNVYRTKELLSYLHAKGIPALFISSDAAHTYDTVYGKYKRYVEKHISCGKLNASFIRPGKINECNMDALCKEIYENIKLGMRQKVTA